MTETYFAAWMGKSDYGDAPSVAITADGHLAASWISSSIYFAKTDLPRALPEGSILTWVDRGALPEPCKGCPDCADPGNAEP